MPERIQMSRQRPWRADNPDAVIVARPGKWGNPYTLGGPGGRDGAVDAFRWLLSEAKGRALEVHPYPSLDEIRAELRGKDLACWCPLHLRCHADVLLELANS